MARNPCTSISANTDELGATRDDLLALRQETGTWKADRKAKV